LEYNLSFFIFTLLIHGTTWKMCLICHLALNPLFPFFVKLSLRCYQFFFRFQTCAHVDSVFLKGIVLWSYSTTFSDITSMTYQFVCFFSFFVSMTVLFHVIFFITQVWSYEFFFYKDIFIIIFHLYILERKSILLSPLRPCSLSLPSCSTCLVKIYKYFGWSIR
jgi:hypothetical protein